MFDKRRVPMDRIPNTGVHGTFCDGLLLAVLAPLHKGYLRAMTGFARFQTLGPSAPRSPEFETLDAAANRAGAIYRGLGVGVGLLSILVLFLAVVPSALELSPTSVSWVKVTKVYAMVAIVAAVTLAVVCPWRRTWTVLRKEAQAKAYGSAGGARNNQDASAEANDVQIKVRDDLRLLVDEQIAYNAMTARKYHRVERMTLIVTYFVFVIALICAALDAVVFLPTSPWKKSLLFGTVFLPGVVGILHGINGFLGVSEQAFSCKLMEDHLTQLRRTLEQLQQPDAAPSREDALAAVSIQIRDVLTRHDDLWAEAVKPPSV
jgi:hypothetical protein